MYRSFRIAIAMCALIALLPRAAATQQSASHVVGPTGVVLPAVDPMADEMRRELDAQQKDYAALLAQLAQAKSEQDAFAIQNTLAQRRIGMQVALLRIQAEYARRAGRDGLAWQLDRTIQALITPDVPKSQRPETSRRD